MSEQGDEPVTGDASHAAAPSDERITVVIPTTGRASLLQAIDSVLAQTVAVDRIVVTVDGPAELVSGLPDDPRIEIVASGERKGPNAARVAGMKRANGGLIALLDDDDVWAPHKNEVQLAAYREAVRGGAEHVVVACRSWFVRPDGSRLSIPPGRTLRRGQAVASYLFDRKSVRSYDSMVSSSMLLFDRALVDLVPFDTSLTRHTDWDWLVRVDATGAARFVMLPDLLLGYTVQQVGFSASSAGNWRNSEDWVRMRSDMLTERQQAEVLLSVTVPLALQQREWIAAARLMADATRLGASYRSWLFSLGHIPLVAGRRVRMRFLRPA